MKKETNGLLSLPKEILIEILTFTPVKTVCQCAQVSKSFKEVADDNRVWGFFLNKKKNAGIPYQTLFENSSYSSNKEQYRNGINNQKKVFNQFKKMRIK